MKKIFTILSILVIFNINSSAQGDDKISIQDVVSKITPTKVMRTIRKLESYETRFMLAQNRFEVANWIKSEFVNMGINDVELQSFTTSTSVSYPPVLDVDTTTTQVNVVATIPGSSRADEIYIICGHYDSFSENSDQFIAAPGADDNASGTAAVIETARAVMESNYTPNVTLRFICFAAEELMLFGDGGSEVYSAEAATRGDDIKFVVNNDMIGNSEKDGLINRTIGIGYPNNFSWADEMFTLAREHSENEIVRQTYTGADLGSFLEQGYLGVYFEEANFSPYYHSTDDVADNMDSLFVTESIKASCSVFFGDKGIYDRYRRK